MVCCIMMIFVISFKIEEQHWDFIVFFPASCAVSGFTCRCQVRHAEVQFDVQMRQTSLSGMTPI